MIYVDTDELKQLANLSKTALEALKEASDILNQVTVHRDWGCKERVKINANIENNRNAIKVLKENGQNFSTVISQIAEEFDSSEKGISKLFENFETVLGNTISIPVKIAEQVGNLDSVWKKIPSPGNLIGEVALPGLDNLNHVLCQEHISILNYKDIAEEFGTK